VTAHRQPKALTEQGYALSIGAKGQSHPSPWLVADAIPYSFAASLITAALAAAFEAGRANPMLPSSLLWTMAVFLAGIALALAGRRFMRDGVRARRN
jgi:hypothetical protein